MIRRSGIFLCSFPAGMISAGKRFCHDTRYIFIYIYLIVVVVIEAVDMCIKYVDKVIPTQFLIFALLIRVCGFLLTGCGYPVKNLFKQRL